MEVAMSRPVRLRIFTSDRVGSERAPDAGSARSGPPHPLTAPVTRWY